MLLYCQTEKEIYIHLIFVPQENQKNQQKHKEEVVS